MAKVVPAKKAREERSPQAIAARVATWTAPVQLNRVAPLNAGYFRVEKARLEAATVKRRSA